MSDNLLLPNESYYHPQTRTPVERAKYWIDANGGEHLEVAPRLPQRRTFLTPEEVCQYYYRALGVAAYPHLKRDAGSVRWMAKQHGLDLTLFAVDALIAHYSEAEERPAAAPALIEANNYLPQALTRLGDAKQLVQQYGLGS